MEPLDFDKRLAEFGVELPPAPAAYARYIPARRSGSQLFISGQLAWQHGQLNHTGKLGGSASLESVREAGRLCGLNILSQVKEACGGTLNRVSHCIRLTGYVNATPDCNSHAEAMDGCSTLLIDVLGDAGLHARTTVGVCSLPLDASIEVDAIFELLEIVGVKGRPA